MNFCSRLPQVTSLQIFDFQTSRVQSSSISSTEKQMALKWVIHFLGDIHQPLHDEALEVGGNGIDVTYDGESTNLHHIW